MQQNMARRVSSSSIPPAEGYERCASAGEEGEASSSAGPTKRLRPGLLTAVVVGLLALWVAVPLIRRQCTTDPAACSVLPAWLSGLHWVSINDPGMIRSAGGSVIDGFVSKYHCSANASHPSHQPRLMFSEPAMVEATLGNKQRRPKEQLDLLVGILSGCNSRELRDAIRHTWQLIDTSGIGTWKAVFIVGRCRSQLADEQQEHGDLLFTSPTESYYALTGKVLDFMSYAHKINAKYTMKTDDDTFIFIDRLLEQLKGMASSCLYWGSSADFLPPFEDVYGPNRTGSKHVLAVPTVKWYIPKADYMIVSETKYLAGGAYILSNNLVDRVVSRSINVPNHLPEDATMGALVGKAAIEQCMCADSRHLKDIDDFQTLRLLRTDGRQGDAKECEVSNAVYRTITIHGLRNPSLHHHILSVARSERKECKWWKQARQAKQRRAYYARGWDIWKAIWGRDVPSRGGHSIFMEAQAHNNMIRCASCGPDRPVPYQTMVETVRENKFDLNPRGFNKAFKVLKSNSSFPVDRTELIPLRGIAKGGMDLPWCTRIEWAFKVSEMVLDLGEQALLLCDLDISRVYINVTTGQPVLSAGKTQWSHARNRKFHANAWCFSDAQCQACFKNSWNMSMAWLPEATCNRKTNRCEGFDGSSQALAAIKHILWPLLMNDHVGDYELHTQVLSLFRQVQRGREMRSRPDIHKAKLLRAGFQALMDRSSVKMCLADSRASVEESLQFEAAMRIEPGLHA